MLSYLKITSDHMSAEYNFLKFNAQIPWSDISAKAEHLGGKILCEGKIHFNSHNSMCEFMSYISNLLSSDMF